MKHLPLAAAVMFAASFGAANTIDKLYNGDTMRFNYTGQEVLDIEKQASADFEDNIKQILAIAPKQRNFGNTILPFERTFNNYWYTVKGLALLAYFHDDEGVRDSAAKLESTGGQFKADVLSRKDIYKAIKDAAKNDPQPKNTQEDRLVTFWLSRFKRAGAELTGKKAQEYAALTRKKMEEITQFNVNLMNYKDQLELTKEQLAGLSDVYINRLARTDEGKYIVTLKYPDYNPFMSNAQDEAARKALQIKFANRGGEENVKLLEDVLQIRSKTSRLLGYKDHPQYVLQDRMAQNKKTLKHFLKDIEKNLKPVGKKELKNYKKLKKEMTGDGKNFGLWDFPYYYNQYMKKYYNVDQEKIKEYFPTDHVIDGMFEVFGNIFGLDFVKADLPKWNKEVLTYQIKDKATGELISNFYLDLYPRDGKYTHAATWSFIDTYQKPDASWQTPSVVIAANMTPAGNGIPSLLNHSEVETLFHEFGHVLQMSLTHPKYASLGGDNITWDYIETHSQLLENWAWQKDTLKKISKHYITGAPLPDDMIDSLVKSKMAGTALPMLRQNFQAQLDYQYHLSNKPVNTTKVYEKMIKKIYLMPLTEGTYPQANFGHIMSLTDPYDVGYYVYAWSLVIADDIFSEFEKQGVYNADLGAKLRKLVYTPGITQDPNLMVNEFLGRPYNNKAFLKNFGIEK